MSSQRYKYLYDYLAKKQHINIIFQPGYPDLFFMFYGSSSFCLTQSLNNYTKVHVDMLPNKPLAHIDALIRPNLSAGLLPKCTHCIDLYFDESKLFLQYQQKY